MTVSFKTFLHELHGWLLIYYESAASNYNDDRVNGPGTDLPFNDKEQVCHSYICRPGLFSPFLRVFCKK
jgi:hypothetical protein